MPRGNRGKKSLCIIDTCALVDLNTVELARRPLQKWLWDEFEIRYSEAVLKEFESFQHKMNFRKSWENYIWKIPNPPTYEKALFLSHQRELEDGRCKRCRQVTWRNETFTPDFAETKDRGERYNCCIALDAVLSGQHAQIIFLTDDFRAIRDYTTYFFDTFPLGNVWSLLDFIIYLFTRYQKNITLEDAKNALRDANAGSNTSLEQRDEELSTQDTRYKESEEKRTRLVAYYKKVERIAQVFSQLPRGHQ